MTTGPELYLIRHGQTEWSLTGQHTGRSDIALTRQGEEEARSLAPWLRQIQFAQVFTSPQQRARRTCELAGLSTAAAVEPGLAEWDYGDYEGKRSTDIRRDRPGWSCFRDGCPGGETPDQVSVRADHLITRFRTLQGAVAMFTHGQFGRAFAARWIGLAVAAGEHFEIATASIGVLGFSPAHKEVPVIALWNAVPGLWAVRAG